jgi:hypothetical protein
MLLIEYTLSEGGRSVSTWVTKLEVHVEDVTNLVKNVTNQIVANKHSNDAVFAEGQELAVAA